MATSNLEKAKIITAVAAKLNVPNTWLDAVVRNESGYRTSIANPAEASSAKGLIQFIDKTAQWLGYASSQELVDQNEDFATQMWGPVLKYFQHYAPYDSLYEFSMAPFLPAMKNKPPNTRLPDWAIKANTVGGVPLFTVTGDYEKLLLKNQINPKKLLTQKYEAEIEQAIEDGDLPRPPAYRPRLKVGAIAVVAAVAAGAWWLIKNK